MPKLTFRAQKGCLFDKLLVGLLIAILLVSGYAIVQSIVNPGPEAVEARLMPTLDLTKDPVYKDWLNDTPGYEQAIAEAKKTKKPIFVYYYAPWCPHCKRFHIHLMSDPKVIEGLKGFIKVRLYPDRDNPKVGEPVANLMQKMGVDGFPNAFVSYDADMFVRLKLHDDSGTYMKPEAFLKQIQDLGK